MKTNPEIWDVGDGQVQVSIWASAFVLHISEN